MTIQPTPGRTEVLGQFKLKGTYEEIPTLSKTTANIFRIMDAPHLSEAENLKAKVGSLEESLKKIPNAKWEKIEMILRGVFTATLIAAIVTTALLAPPFVAIPAAFYLAMMIWNGVKAKVGPVHLIPLLPAVCAPFYPIYEWHKKSQENPVADFEHEKNFVLQECKKLGTSFEKQSPDLEVRLNEEIEQMRARVQTPTNQQSIKEFQFAVEELRACRDYFTQFKD